MNLFNLYAKLSLDNSDYEKGLDQSKKSASSFSSKAGVAFKAVGRAVTAVIGAVTAATSAIAALAVKSINYGDDIDKMSQKLGLSAEAYQNWTIAAEMAGSDAATLQTGIRQLTKFIQDLSDGTGESLLTLQELGIGYEDFMNMSFDDQLKTVVEAMQGLESQTDRTRIAQELFGSRAYQELMPLLNQEQGSIDELFASYKDLGLVMSDDVVEASARLNDKITLMTKSWQMMFTTLTTQGFPAFEEIIDALTMIAQGGEKADEGIMLLGQGITDFVAKVVEMLPDLLDKAVDILMNLIDVLLDVISSQEFIDGLVLVINKIIDKVVEILPKLLSSAITLVTALISGLLQIDWLSILEQVFVAILDAMPDLVNGLVNSIGDLLSKFFSDPTAFLNKIVSVAKNIGKSWINAFASVFTNLDSKFGILDWFKNLANQAKTWGTTIGKNLINNIISGIETGLNWIIDKINAVSNGISKIWTWAGIPSIPNIEHVSIKRLAQGTDSIEDLLQGSKGTVYALAGEAGAEAVYRSSRGTGVLNATEFGEEMLRAMQDYGFDTLVGRAVEGIVNGLGAKIAMLPRESGQTVIYADNSGVSSLNRQLNRKGRQTINTVTSY